MLGAGAVSAGLLVQRIGIPAAWLIGPMVAAIVYTLMRREPPQNLPLLFHNAALAVIGTVLATSFRPSTLSSIVANWPSVLLVVVGTLLFGLVGGLALSWVTGLELKTTALGTLPGAASGMLVISDSLNADTRLVALLQFSRVVLVVLSGTLISRFFTPQSTTTTESDVVTTSTAGSLPEYLLIYGATAAVTLIGAWSGWYLRIPAGILIGPLIIGVVLKELGLLGVALPFGVPQIAYAVIGVYVGLLFDSATVRQAGRLLPAALASILALMAGCAGLGWILATLTGTGMLTGYLATTPGGLSSVAVIAVESGADPSLAVAVQMLRIFAVVVTAPLLVRWWSPPD